MLSQVQLDKLWARRSQMEIITITAEDILKHLECGYTKKENRMSTSIHLNTNFNKITEPLQQKPGGEIPNHHE